MATEGDAIAWLVHIDNLYAELARRADQQQMPVPGK